MTKRQLKYKIFYVSLFLTIAIIIGIFICDVHFDRFAKLIPLIIALPAAYLAYCFQRRASYMQALRSLWTNLVKSINIALQYTHKDNTTQQEHSDALMALGISIDEVRAIFKNIKEQKEDINLYPFESLKEIFNIIDKLGFGTNPIQVRKIARDSLVKNWKIVRSTILVEFDRSEPTAVDSPYIK